MLCTMQGNMHAHMHTHVQYTALECTYLHHLGVQPLSHLHPSVGEEDRAISVHVQESTTLIQESYTKCYPVFGGYQ